MFNFFKRTGKDKNEPKSEPAKEKQEPAKRRPIKLLVLVKPFGNQATLGKAGFKVTLKWEEITIEATTGEDGVAQFDQSEIAKIVGKKVTVLVDGHKVKEWEIPDRQGANKEHTFVEYDAFGADEEGGEEADADEEGGEEADANEEGGEEADANEEGGEEADANEEGGEEEKPKPSAIETFFTKRSNLIWVAIASAILLLGFALLIGSFLGQNEAVASETQSLEAQPPAQPNLTPIDLKNASWYSPLHWLQIMFAFALLGAAFGDAKMRNQMMDFAAVIIGIFSIMSINTSVTLFSGFLENRGFYDPQQQLVVVSIAGFLIAILSVGWATMHGGMDLTPSFIFVALLCIAGMLFGNLGAMQVLLNIPEAPVLPWDQMATLFTLLNYDQIKFTLWIYALLLIALGLGGLEVASSIQRIAGDGKKIWSILATGIGLPIYVLLRSWLYPNNVPILVIAFIAMVLTALAVATTIQRGGPGGEKFAGEVTVSSPFIPPFDKFSVQIVLATLIIALTGKI